MCFWDAELPGAGIIILAIEKSAKLYELEYRDQITNLATQQLAHTQTDTLNNFWEYSPAHLHSTQPHPSQAVHSYANTKSLAKEFLEILTFEYFEYL